MIHDWNRAVSAVLDHMQLSSCALLGVSLGGCLSLRAAAHEPRSKRVIAYDILTDLFACLAGRMGEKKAKPLTFLLRHNMSGLVNRLMTKAAAQDSVTQWAVEHGQHVSGASTPAGYLQWTQGMTTAEISHLVTQDVLLLAGTEDHLVPLQQLYDQQKTLTNARSVSTRLFTADESAAAHCQVGNQPLVRRVMIDWMKERLASVKTT